VVLCGISPPFERLSPSSGQITHVLLTRAPLYRGLPPFSCDLHVLGAPLTFALSQDQTLQLNFSIRRRVAPTAAIFTERANHRPDWPCCSSNTGHPEGCRIRSSSEALRRVARLGASRWPRERTVDSTCNQVFKDRASFLARGAGEALDRVRDLEEALALPPLASLSSSGGGVYRRPLSLSNLIFSDRLFSAAVAALFRAAPSSGGGVYRRAPSASTTLCTISLIALSGRRFLATRRCPGGR
jgi:hypothetical protein